MNWKNIIDFNNKTKSEDFDWFGYGGVEMNDVVFDVYMTVY